MVRFPSNIRISSYTAIAHIFIFLCGHRLGSLCPPRRPRQAPLRPLPGRQRQGGGHAQRRRCPGRSMARCRGRSHMGHAMDRRANDGTRDEGHRFQSAAVNATMSTQPFFGWKDLVKMATSEIKSWQNIFFRWQYQDKESNRNLWSSSSPSFFAAKFDQPTFALSNANAAVITRMRTRCNSTTSLQ